MFDTRKVIKDKLSRILREYSGHKFQEVVHVEFGRLSDNEAGIQT